MRKRTTLVVTLVVEGDQPTAVGATWDHLKRWFNERERQEKFGRPRSLLWYSIQVVPENIDVFQAPAESVVS